jgi:FKBP-type peptidyl-prolyl cis-trans isomerase FkpA
MLFVGLALGACQPPDPATSASDAPAAVSEAPPASEAAAFETEADKTLYALGVTIGRSLDRFALTPEELEVVKAGLSDVVLGREPAVDVQQYRTQIQELQTQRRDALAAEEKTASAAFLAAEAKAEGAESTESGLIFTEVVAGTGESPQATSIVKVHYHGALRDGTVFDSSVDRGEPAQFPLNRVIPCWTEGLQKMKVGGKARLVCPSDIAYGNRGAPPRIPGGAALAFDVELIEIVSSGE